MTSEQISNKQIKQFFDTYIKGKKGIYFLITTGSFYDQKFNPFHPKSEEFSGEAMFLKTLENVFDDDCYQIGIELYEKAVKKIKADPFYHKTFILKKEEPTTKNNGLDGLGLGSFGGIEGILDSKLSAKYLSGENERLKKENEILKSDNSVLSKKISSHTEELAKLKNDVRVKDWEIKTAIDDHKRELANVIDDHKRNLRGVEDKNNKFEKILTIGGLIAAKTAGIKEEDLKGILGIEEDNKTSNAVEDNNKNTNTTSAADIKFEEEKEYTGKKADAKKIIDNVNDILVNILDANNDEDAYKIIAAFYNIIGYANLNIENLTKLNEIVISGFEAKNKKTAAETIIEAADNYSSK